MNTKLAPQESDPSSQPVLSSICVDCGGVRGHFSFGFTCAQCSERYGFQTMHCARCVVQFHENHPTSPLCWPDTSTEWMALRYLTLMKMSKEVKSANGGTEGGESSESPSPDSTLGNALPDISYFLPKRN